MPASGTLIQAAAGGLITRARTVCQKPAAAAGQLAVRFDEQPSCDGG
jgi:hypothetical protein